MTDIILSIAGSAFGVPMDVDLQLAGGPFSFSLKTQQAISIKDIWNTFSEQLDSVTGISLPTIPPGPWDKIMDVEIIPSLWITPDGTTGNTSAFLQLTLKEELSLGTHFNVGPIDISIEPNITITGILIGYDGAGDGLTVKAKIKTPVSSGGANATANPAKNKEQLVNFPFPLPAQNSLSAFRLNYLGIGQRVGPTVQVTGADDPLAKIFEQLETQLVGNDPETIITELAQNFYHPDRDWFIAADLQLRELRLRILFNDPVMYGLEISIPMTSPPSFFSGLLFEILYQKLGPNLGVYYGALTLPYGMRRIPLEGFILILPGFSIWVYTNGDFRINVGWPVSPNNSIGISFDILTGWAGFYFAKLRSGDNPGALPSVNYNPILEFGIGIAVSASVGISAGPLSASLSASLTATFQGLLAWQSTGSGSSLSDPPDHYWFAGTASIAVVLQGSVDLAIIKASVLVSFSASAGVAFETGYQTVIPVSASVSVRVSIKVVFFTIHLSFHTTVSHTFYIGSGTPASLNGPLAPGLNVMAGPSLHSLLYDRARDSAYAMRAQMADAFRPLHDTQEPPRFRTMSASNLRAGAAASPALTELDVVFVLQPTVVYDTSQHGTVNLIASLVMDCPAPGQGPLASPGAATGFEVLIVKLVKWLLTFVPAGSPDMPLSATLQALSDALGGGGAEPGPVFGGRSGFVEKLEAFFANTLRFTIRGLSSASPAPFDVAAVLPMFDALRLQANGNTVDFSEFNRTPDNYTAAINLYFDNMGLIGASVPDGSEPQALGAQASPPSGPSMATYLFGDYFLLIARYTVSTLLHDAQAYEAQQEAQLKAWAKRSAAGSDDPFEVTSVLGAYAGATNPTQELTTLLDNLGYWGIAGFGSRYLMSGLQLPEPSQVPAQLDPKTIAAIPTAPLYVLSGQQYALDGSPNDNAATLSFTPGQTANWIQFADGSPAHALTQIDLPTSIPAAPNPKWVQIGSPASPPLEPPNTIVVQPLAALTTAPLGYQLKNQLAWSASAAARTLFNFPQPLLNQLQNQAPLQLSLQGVQADDNTTVPVAGVATLQIRLSLTQVAGSTPNSSGSPTASPASPAPVYLPNVYQLNGTDEATRELIYQALQGNLSTAKISVLYLPPGSSEWVSETLDPHVLLAKLNLSTLNQVEQVSFAHTLMAARLTTPETSDSALLTDVADFLRLIWELSVVRAPGYYLYYRTEAGQGLPADLFADTATSNASPTDPAQKVVPGTASGTANLTLVVEFATAPASKLTLAAYQNSLWVATDSEITTLVCDVADSSGEPLYAYQSAYAPGQVGFTATWTPAVEPSPAPPIAVNELYHLIQYQIDGKGTAYTDSVWSLPVGPTSNDTKDSGDSPDPASAAWQLQQLVPLLPFYATADSPAPTNPYAIVGQPATLEFRLCDIYGNALEQTYGAPFTPRYSDPLIALGEWPGLQSTYYFASGTAGAAQLLIALTFDPNIVAAAASPDNTQAQWQRMRDKYQLICDQLDDSNTQYSITCSLVGTASLGDPRAQLQPFAAQILAYIDTQLGGSPVGSVSLKSMALGSPAAEIATQLNVAVPFAALAQQAHDIVDIGVSVNAQRTQDLVDAQALAKLPQAYQVSYQLLAKLDLPPPGANGSPASGSSNIGVFAQYFEQAFANFDGQGGMLKLAQRSGTQVSDASNTAPDLWSVRFSAGQGFAADFSGELVYFALRPLNTAPRSGLVDNVQYTDIDMDAWASQFFSAFDAFLSPQMGVAVALLDAQNGTDYYDQLMSAKQTLAQAVPTGLVPILQKDADSGAGDTIAAQKRLQQAMLQALASAYTVSTVVQASATLTVNGIADNTSPQQAPQLYGSLVQNASGSPAGASDAAKLYQFSPVNLDLASGTQWATSLLTVSQPGHQARIELPLEYNVSYLQHDFEPGEAYQGYVPSSWLKFALPGAAPLLLPITGDGSPASSPTGMAVIPVPLPFEPPLPLLIEQLGQGVALGSPSSSPESLSAEIEQALQWRYQVQVAADLESQDEFFFDLVKNTQVDNASSLPSRQRNAPPLDELFAALARFNAAYPALARQFSSVLQEAYGGGGAGVQSAGAIVKQFYELADGVASAWPTQWGQFKALFEVTSDIDHFCLTFLQLATNHFQLQLRAKTDQGAQNPAIWPTLLLANAPLWAPDRNAAKQDDEGWWSLTHDITLAPDFSPLTLTWEPLAVLDCQSALFNAWTVRNADLVPDQATNPLFIYQTDETRFPNAMIPLIDRDSLPEVNVGAISLAVLQQILLDIFTPLSAVVSTGVNPVINLQANYAYALVPGPAEQTLLAESPVLLISALELDNASPTTIADEVAAEIWNWYQTAQPPTAQSRMEFAFTLFGTVDGQQLPLVQINKIPVVFS